MVLIKGNSFHASTHHALRAAMGDTLADLCFIDGDHSFDGVMKDFMNFEPFVRPGGLIVLDDYNYHYWPEICRFVALHIRSQPTKFTCVGVYEQNELIILKK